MNFETIKTDFKTKKKYRSGVFQKGVHVSVYLYGFNGMERDDEARGKGNQYQFGDYSYDPRLARRFNIDPMAPKYAWQSPYAVFNNNPIYYKDPSGLEGEGSDESKPKNTSQRKIDRRMSKFERKAERVANQLGLDVQNLSQQDFNQIKSNMDSRYGTKDWYYIINQSSVTSEKGGLKSSTGHQGLTNAMILSDYWGERQNISTPTTVTTPFTSTVPDFVLGQNINLTWYNFSTPIPSGAPNLSVNISLINNLPNAAVDNLSVSIDGTNVGNTNVSSAGDGMTVQNISGSANVNISYNPSFTTMANISNPTGSATGINWSGPIIRVTFTGSITRTMNQPFFGTPAIFPSVKTQRETLKQIKTFYGF